MSDQNIKYIRVKTAEGDDSYDDFTIKAAIAETAETLTTDAGESGKPVYITGGIPVQIDKVDSAVAADKLTTVSVGAKDHPVYIDADGTPQPVSADLNYTDQYVTNPAYHYDPALNTWSKNDMTIDSNDSTISTASTVDNSVGVVTGLQTDEKGHITQVYGKRISSTDQSVTVGHHYKYSSEEKDSDISLAAQGGTESDITNNPTQVISGIILDDAGHIKKISSIGLKSTDNALQSNIKIKDYYVNSKTGDDNKNDGLSAETPFKTIQHAINLCPTATLIVPTPNIETITNSSDSSEDSEGESSTETEITEIITSYNFSSYSNIHLAAGTYAEAIYIYGKNINLVGDTFTTVNNVSTPTTDIEIISSQPSLSSAINISNRSMVTIKNIRTLTVTGYLPIQSTNYSRLDLDVTNFTAYVYRVSTDTSTTYAALKATSNGLIDFNVKGKILIDFKTNFTMSSSPMTLIVFYATSNSFISINYYDWEAGKAGKTSANNLQNDIIYPTVAYFELCRANISAEIYVNCCLFKTTESSTNRYDFYANGGTIKIRNSFVTDTTDKNNRNITTFKSDCGGKIHSVSSSEATLKTYFPNNTTFVTFCRANNLPYITYVDVQFGPLNSFTLSNSLDKGDKYSLDITNKYYRTADKKTYDNYYRPMSVSLLNISGTNSSNLLYTPWSFSSTTLVYYLRNIASSGKTFGGTDKITGYFRVAYRRTFE